MDFYKGKKVLITGNTGYKGAWLAKMLKFLGAEVYGVSIGYEENSLYGKFKEGRIETYFIDITNFEKIKAFINQINPEIVFHLAAQAYVDESINNPLRTYQTNILGLANILECVRASNTIRSVVVVTSDKCYENNGDGTAYKEGAPLGAADPYSTSKACQELVAQSYYKTFLSNLGINLATARASNVIGGGDFNTKRLLPYVIDSFLCKKQPELRSVSAIRPWQNILDVLYGYLLLGEKLNNDNKYCIPFNFGPNEASFISVGRIVEMLSEYFENARYVSVQTKHFVEADILKLDSTRAKHLLGWFPLLSLEGTVQQTAEFHKEIYGGKDADTVCDFYISRYFKSVNI